MTHAVHAHALCKAGQWEKAAAAMAAMEAQGLPLDVRLYTSLVYGSAKAGQVKSPLGFRSLLKPDLNRHWV